MQQDSIQKTGNLGGLRDANSAGIAAEAAPFTNADVLAKALLKIKLILDIEKALRTISTSEAPEILDPFKIRF